MLGNEQQRTTLGKQLDGKENIDFLIKFINVNGIIPELFSEKIHEFLETDNRILKDT